jgi:hypothetical protein
VLVVDCLVVGVLVIVGGSGGWVLVLVVGCWWWWSCLSAGDAGAGGCVLWCWGWMLGGRGGVEVTAAVV